MQVITSSTSPQEIKVIPRYEPTSTIRYILRSEDENKEFDRQSLSAGNFTYSNGYLTFNIQYNTTPRLVEGQFYQLTIEETASPNRLIYRGKLYCTDQSVLPKFTTQEDEFDEYEDNNNEFVIIT